MNEIFFKFFVLAFYTIGICCAGRVPALVNKGVILSEPFESTTIPTSPTTRTTWPATTRRPKECPFFEDNPYGVLCFYWGGQCYCYAKTSSTNWDGAKEFCRAGNMTLLNVETEEEDYTIFTNGKYNPGLYYAEYWTAGRYSQDGNNEWEWASTQPFIPMNYTHWYAEEPGSSEPGSCTSFHFYYGDFYQWGWSDYPCSNYAGAICESVSVL